jgi:serine 3-dehydrogenase
MESLKNKLVFVTGASSGIGAASAKAFAGEGTRLLLAARRKDRLKKMSDQLKKEFKIDIHFFELDVRDQKDVAKRISSLPREWVEIDILINNAGLSRGLDKVYEGSIQDWDEMIDTNVKGLLYVSRAVIPGMVKQNRGHIVNIGSIAGREVYPGGNVYCASKHAVDAITKGMRMDLQGTNIRVSTIDPGLVETEFSEVRFHGDKNRAAIVYQGLKPLTPEDVADAIIYCVTRPAHVNIAEMLIFPSAQASSMLVHREKK